MTSAKTAKAGPARYSTTPGGHFRFPDPPERMPEDMTSFKQLTTTGAAYFLAQHLGRPATTLVTGERYMAAAPVRTMEGLRIPDLLIAFDVDPELYEESNAYVLSEQGKPPDFVLEIASPSTRRADATEKRDAYAALGIAEYWRFDEKAVRRPRLVGERLVEGEYQAFPIERLPDSVLQGYSPVLDLYLRWDQGQLQWHDPATGRRIVTFEDERARAEQAVAELEDERVRIRILQEIRIQAETRARGEQEARIQAEARNRELEAELRRMRGE